MSIKRLFEIFGGGTPVSKENETAAEKENTTECCVYCLADTGIPVSTPVRERKHYVIGCGQLCSECYAKIKFDSKSEEDLTEEELELLLEISAHDSK